MTDGTYVAATLADGAAIRHTLVEHLRASGFSEDRVHDVAVATTELITNAIVHTQARATVRIDLSRRSVRVGVADDDPRIPRIQHADPLRVGGNGLRIVDALADAWGTLPQPGNRKEVWFRVDR